MKCCFFVVVLPICSAFLTYNLDLHAKSLQHRKDISYTRIGESNLFLVLQDDYENGNEKHKRRIGHIWTRRQLFISSVLLSLTYCSRALAYEDDAPTECKNGGIVSESAVPGAYQNQCMNIAERTFTVQSTNDNITIKQGLTLNSGVAGKTGAAVWNSGILLTRLLDKINQVDSTFLKGKSIVELGCGVALASIAAAKLGASKVYATDNNPEVLSLAQRNIELNNASNAKTALLQWGFLDAFEFESSADLILGSDLTYNPNTWRALAESMVTILKPGGMVIYLSLGHSGFNVAGEMSGFSSVAENAGLRKVNNYIESLLSQILARDERSIVDANGGARVMLFTKR